MAIGHSCPAKDAESGQIVQTRSSIPGGIHPLTRLPEPAGEIRKYRWPSPNRCKTYPGELSVGAKRRLCGIEAGMGALPRPRGHAVVEPHHVVWGDVLVLRGRVGFKPNSAVRVVAVIRPVIGFVDRLTGSGRGCWRRTRSGPNANGSVTAKETRAQPRPRAYSPA
jgi:hypothetical protein